MKQHTVHLLILLAIVVGAFAFRLPYLSLRPMHADESVQITLTQRLWMEGRYAYNPDEFHGPMLAYATLPIIWIERPATPADTTEATYRIVPVLFGGMTILLFWLLRDGLGGSAVCWAALLAAVSPALVYYSRYYIHETLFTFWSLAVIAAGWRYYITRRIGWCLACGVFCGAMQATKETSVLTFFSMTSAVVINWRLFRRTNDRDVTERSRVALSHLAAAGLTALAIAIMFFSSFFTHPRGPWDGVLTYLPWLNRAGGESPHIHPWYDYLHRLAGWRVADGPLWSEGTILGLAIIGIVLSFRSTCVKTANRIFLRWLVFYTVLLTATYCVIPYKTPWCLLGFWHGLILLAGFGAAGLLRLMHLSPVREVAVVGLMLGIGQLAWQAYEASYVAAADPGNPYVYAHTLPDIQRLAKDVDDLAQAVPDRYGTAVKVIWSDTYYWPLPWYLRKFHQVGYWPDLPEDPQAPIVISTPDHDAALTKVLDETHLMTGYYGIRSNVLAQLWVRLDVWEAHLRKLGRL